MGSVLKMKWNCFCPPAIKHSRSVHSSRVGFQGAKFSPAWALLSSRSIWNAGWKQPLFFCDAIGPVKTIVSHIFDPMGIAINTIVSFSPSSLAKKCKSTVFSFWKMERLRQKLTLRQGDIRLGKIKALIWFVSKALSHLWHNFSLLIPLRSQAGAGVILLKSALIYGRSRQAAMDGIWRPHCNRPSSTLMARVPAIIPLG